MEQRVTNIIGIDVEQADTKLLVSKITSDEWFKPSTILVNCMPDYSSRLTQGINHSLSSYNKNELLEVIDLPMPFPSYSQVWNPVTKSYENFETYLKNWINDNLYPCNFLFICSKVHDGKILNKVRLSVSHKLENECFRFASLYVRTTTFLTPDFYIKQYPDDVNLLHHWENPLNKNFDN